jgi:hypothetical protein
MSKTAPKPAADNKSTVPFFAKETIRRLTVRTGVQAGAEQQTKREIRAK